MQTENLAEILRQHPFLAGLSDSHMQVLIDCASNVRFAEGAPLIQEGEIANKFYLVRTGRIALETDVNARGKIRIQTVGLDGECLRKKCEQDHDFGYEMLSRFSHVMERRLEATRMQLLDLYTIPPGAQA
jgi:CRP-like cAMP-binding protein